MPKSEFEQFATSFFSLLSEIKENDLEKIKTEIKDELPPGVSDEKVLKKAKSFLGKDLKKAQREIAHRRTRRYFDEMPQVQVFQLPTGSGKTLLYTLMALYLFFKEGGDLKIAIAGRSNTEINQILEHLFAVKLLLKAIYNKGLKLTLGDEEIGGRKLKKLLDKMIIGVLKGTREYVCPFKAESRKFLSANISRKTCERLRALGSDQGCEFKLSKLKDVFYGKNVHPLKIVMEARKHACDLLADYLSSVFGRFVVTNHATLRQALRGSILHKPVLGLDRRFSYELYKVAKFISAGIRTANMSKNDRAAIIYAIKGFIEKRTPKRTLIIIDEADMFIEEVGKEGDLSIGVTLVPLKKNSRERNAMIKTLLDELFSKIEEIDKSRYARRTKEMLIKKAIKEKLPLVFKSIAFTEARLIDEYLLIAGTYVQLGEKNLGKVNAYGEHVGAGRYRILLDLSDSDLRHALICPLLERYYRGFDDIEELKDALAEKDEALNLLLSIENTAYYEASRYFEVAKIFDKPGAFGVNPCYARYLDDIKLYVTITAGDRYYLGMKISVYSDPIETFKNLASVSERIMMFSATYDPLILYMLFTRSRNIAPGGGTEIDRTTAALYIYAGGREGDFNILVYREASGKNRQMETLKEAIKSTGTEEALRGNTIREFLENKVQGLLLWPANNDVRMFKRELESVGSTLRSEVKKNIIGLDKIEYFDRSPEEIDDYYKKPLRKAAERLRFEDFIRTLKHKIDEIYMKRRKGKLKEKELDKRISELEKLVKETIGEEGVRNYFYLTNVSLGKLIRKKGEKFLLRKLVLFKHMVENMKRNLLIDYIRKLSGEGKEFLVVATGALARGFDMKELNLVIVGRSAYPPTDKITVNELEERRLKNMRIDPEIFDRVERIHVSQSSSKGEEDLLIGYMAVSNLIRQTLQAVGRLTRGGGKKLGMIADMRFYKYFKDFDSIYQEVVQRLQEFASYTVEIIGGDTPLGYVKRFIKLYGRSKK